MTAPELRAEKLVGLIGERELDILLVTSPVNIRYLSGFTGTNGICVVGRGERHLVTDFRYIERAEQEAPTWEIIRGKQDLLDSVVELVSEGPDGSAKVGFDDAHLTMRTYERLREKLPEPVELVPAGGLVERLRAVKDEGEVERIREAARVADALYVWLVQEHGLAGRSERDVVRAIERRAQDIGADGVSFPPIVAAGANGALPHASPRDVEIPRDTLVIVDLGCVVDGYCSDCTRTFATGSIDDEAREAYELVRSAQATAAGAVRAGADVREVDAAARKRIEDEGRGEQFGHGTGHGVGLEVHEEPRVAPSGEGCLESGNVVTVEPGVYVPGRFGVRIEDLLVVTRDGAETLTSVPRELTTV